MFSEPVNFPAFLGKIVYSKAAIVLATIVTILVCLSLYLNSRALGGHSQDSLKTLQAQLDNEKTQVSQLQQTLTDAKSSYAKEKIIRDQLLMQKPGEYVVQLPDLPSLPPQQITETKKLTPWENWKTVLGLP